MIDDVSSVPNWPVVEVRLTDDGSVTVDGIQQAVPPGDDPRAVGLDQARRLAAVLGRPVRVDAYEADGTGFPMVIDGDGDVAEAGPPITPARQRRGILKRRPQRAPAPAPPLAPGSAQTRHDVAAPGAPVASAGSVASTSAASDAPTAVLPPTPPAATAPEPVGAPFPGPPPTRFDTSEPAASRTDTAPRTTHAPPPPAADEAELWADVWDEPVRAEDELPTAAVTRLQPSPAPADIAHDDPGNDEDDLPTAAVTRFETSPVPTDVVDEDMPEGRTPRGNDHAPETPPTAGQPVDHAALPPPTPEQTALLRRVRDIAEGGDPRLALRQLIDGTRDADGAAVAGFREVEAYLLYLSGHTAEAAQLYVRTALRHAEEFSATWARGLVECAHHCWLEVPDTDRAFELGDDIISAYSHLGATGSPEIIHARRHLESLRARLSG